MTHTLHRYGNKDNLKNDFTILAMPAKGINDEGGIEKRKKFYEMAFKYKVDNAGGTDISNLQHSHDKKEFINKIANKSRTCTICLPDPKDVKSLLIDLKKEDLGLSVVVQGLEEDIQNILHEVELKIDTANHSLGIMGNLDILPSDEILEITTMCGHGLISKNLVRKCIKDISSGKITPEEAANILAEPCHCGIFNKKRAKNLLSKYVNL